jgi:hypothetical protein
MTVYYFSLSIIKIIHKISGHLIDFQCLEVNSISTYVNYRSIEFNIVKKKNHLAGSS